MEAFLAVPMAAAAYGIGPSDRDFNGFWGIGFQWQKILLTWITAALSILVFAIVSLDLLTEEFHASSVVHLIVSYTMGQAPDFVAHPINPPVFDTAGAQAIGVILMFFCVYLPSPFWVATCVVAFREALAVEEKERIRNLPTKAELLEQQRAKSKKAETLWKQRMPGALKPPQ
ncbi:hypothetical protein [Cochlodiniinecator piscidefendens]|uniref:hypothetical protein n=1 Tax=Cochlodiniinecator piscidefendens TaxID=2715756 RepID=UPI00140C8313|nr:hypothetical protein [Cochlodiniinecator piscidefendens]